MMKLNQLLMSFLFILGLTNTTLQAGQAIKVIKVIGGGFATAGRIATNRASLKEEQTFMMVNSGAFLLEFMNGLLKATPSTPLAEGQSPTFMQTLSVAVTGNHSIGDALRQAGQNNLDQLVQWFKDKRRNEMESAVENGTRIYTPAEIEKNIKIIEKATAPVVRLLKGQSKIYERVGIWLSLRIVSIINGIRNTFTSGRKLNDVTTMVGEATTFVASLALNRAFVMVEQGLEYLTERAQAAGQSVIDGLAQAGETTGNVIQATREVVTNSYNDLRTTLDSIISGTSQSLSTLFNRFSGQEERFYDSSEISNIVLELFVNKEELETILKELSLEEYTQAIKDIAFDIKLELKAKNTSQATIDLLFSNIDKGLTDATLRAIDVTDFSKLPENQLKNEIIKAWQSATSADLTEALVNLQQPNIDKRLLEAIGKNPEWAHIKPEKLIQIPEALYEFLSITTLAQIEKALKATPKDFDTINKLTTLSFVTDNAWKNATAQELLDFPTEFYTELSEAHLKQIEKQINLTDAQLPLEAQMNNPYQKQITLLEVEQAKRASAINNDSQSIQKQAADAQKQQADQVAQHTTTTPTQTMPETSGTATNQELPNFDTIPSRPRSDSTTSADFHDPHETAEEFQKAHERELLEKQAQEEAAKRRAEQAIKEHEIAAEHAITQVHGL